MWLRSPKRGVIFRRSSRLIKNHEQDRVDTVGRCRLTVLMQPNNRQVQAVESACEKPRCSVVRQVLTSIAGPAPEIVFPRCCRNAVRTTSRVLFLPGKVPSGAFPAFRKSSRGPFGGEVIVMKAKLRHHSICAPLVSSPSSVSAARALGSRTALASSII